MKVSTRFSMGVHILAMLDVCREMPCTSEFIAGSVNTNSVVECSVESVHCMFLFQNNENPKMVTTPAGLR